MADPRHFELDELLIRPGTYYHPETEILLVVDDSPELDAEALGLDDADGSDWVLIADEVPVDEHQRDALLDAFQIRHNPDAAHDEDADEEDEDEDHELGEDDGELEHEDE